MKFVDVKAAIATLLRWRKGEAIGTGITALVVAVATAIGSPALLGLSLLAAVIGNTVRLVFREAQVQRDSRKWNWQWDTQPLVPLFTPEDVLPLAEWERELLRTAQLDTENAEENKA